MPLFNYTARDKTGKVVHGKVEAANEREAASLVREREMLVTALVEQKKSSLSLSFIRFQKVRFGDIVSFTRQLSTMVTAGLQVQEALELLKGQTNNSAMVVLLSKISREIQGGGNLGDALSKYPKNFSTSYIALVRAGESSGKLDTVLERLAENLEKDQEFRAKVKNAMIYPVIILIAMVVVFTLLMMFVVPQLTEIYVDFGADLPFSTRILQGLSKLMISYWWVMIIVSVGGYKLFRKWISTSVGKRMWDGLILKLPIFGKLQQEVILVEFTRTLSMLVGAGVHILDSLNIMIESLDNWFFKDALKDITRKVEKGFPLGNLFARYTIFPPILTQMVKVGEETGKIDESLMKLSLYFERESDHTIKGLTTAIEPIIMVILGVGVGFIVFSIITPIYNLTTQFK